MEHEPWIGEQYEQQRAGEKLAIVGFSHWGQYSDDREDDPDFTGKVVRTWALNGEIRFFNAIASYFNEEPRSFWNRVAFFNTLPTTVGGEDDRYSAGSPEQWAAVPARVPRLINELRPDRIFVFSRKAWNGWPDYTGSFKDGTLRVDGVDEVDCGGYAHADGEAIAFGLRHPQFARTEDMRAIVAKAMAFRPEDAGRGGEG